MTHPGTRARLIPILLALAFLVPAGVSAQQVLTAVEFFDTVAANYASIEDYTAEMVWRDEGGTMRGTLT